MIISDDSNIRRKNMNKKFDGNKLHTKYAKELQQKWKKLMVEFNQFVKCKECELIKEIGNEKVELKDIDGIFIARPKKVSIKAAEDEVYISLVYKIIGGESADVGQVNEWELNELEGKYI